MSSHDPGGQEARSVEGRTAAFLAETRDLDPAIAYVQDAASVAQSLWLTYLGVLVYIGIAAGAVTHEDLFLQRPVRLPFLGDVPLPLVSFFVLAPIVFVIWHAYALLHLGVLAAKAQAFEDQLAQKVRAFERGSPDIGAQQAAAIEGSRRAHLRLPSNIFVQMLSAPQLYAGRIGLVSGAIGWISLVLGPILLLLLIQIQFLPFHSEPVTWLHRLLIVLDLVLLWAFWPTVLSRGKDIRSPGQGRPLFLATACLTAVMSVVLARFPGEFDWGGRKWIPPNGLLTGLGAYHEDKPVWTSLHALMFNGPYDEEKQRRRSLFSNTLVLPGFDASALPASASAEYTLVRKRGRFEQAIFRGANLSRINFENARLDGAVFYQAKLDRAQLYQARLDGADLYQATLQGASFAGATLVGANLREARLEGAYLFQAGLQGTNLEKARLQGADIDEADARGAKLENADLRGATLHGARLEDASFKSAQLQGAYLKGAQLARADLSYANLDLARLARTNLGETNLTGADLNRVLPESDKMSAADIAAMQPQIADRLESFVCSLRDESVARVLSGLIRPNDGILRESGPYAPRLVARIFDPKCPASSYLTDVDKAKLAAFAAKLSAAPP